MDSLPLSLSLSLSLSVSHSLTHSHSHSSSLLSLAACLPLPLSLSHTHALTLHLPLFPTRCLFRLSVSPSRVLCQGLFLCVSVSLAPPPPPSPSPSHSHSHSSFLARYLSLPFRPSHFSPRPPRPCSLTRGSSLSHSLSLTHPLALSLFLSPMKVVARGGLSASSPSTRLTLLCNTDQTCARPCLVV